MNINRDESSNIRARLSQSRNRLGMEETVLAKGGVAEEVSRGNGLESSAVGERLPS